MIDIFITAYLRTEFTDKTLEYLYYRTKMPYRLWLIDNGGNRNVWQKWRDKPGWGNNFQIIESSQNLGIHAAWNIAKELAVSDYFITSDNDIYVPQLEPDWLSQLVELIKKRPDYAAISLHPHVFIGAPSVPVDYPEDVVERNMCGAVMRIMKTDLVRKVGGWDHVLRPQRNGEEKVICGKLIAAGYKVGIASRLRAYHPFGDNWGYPKEITPKMQGHRPELADYVKNFDRIEAYDEKTWFPK